MMDTSSFSKGNYYIKKELFGGGYTIYYFGEYIQNFDDLETAQMVVQTLNKVKSLTSDKYQTVREELNA